MKIVWFVVFVALLFAGAYGLEVLVQAGYGWVFPLVLLVLFPGAMLGRR